MSETIERAELDAKLEASEQRHNATLARDSRTLELAATRFEGRVEVALSEINSKFAELVTLQAHTQRAVSEAKWWFITAAQ